MEERLLRPGLNAFSHVCASKSVPSWALERDDWNRRDSGLRFGFARGRREFWIVEEIKIGKGATLYPVHMRGLLLCGNEQESSVGLIWAKLLALPPTTSATMTKLPTPSEPQFPRL